MRSSCQEEWRRLIQGLLAHFFVLRVAGFGTEVARKERTFSWSPTTTQRCWRQDVALTVSYVVSMAAGCEGARGVFARHDRARFMGAPSLPLTYSLAISPSLPHYVPLYVTRPHGGRFSLCSAMAASLGQPH